MRAGCSTRLTCNAAPANRPVKIRETISANIPTSMSWWPFRGSEERHLFAEKIGIDRRLPEPVLEFAGRGGAVPRKSVRDVAVDVRHLLRQLFHGFAPRVYFVRAIDLNAGVVDQVAVGAHPPYVGEIRG